MTTTRRNFMEQSLAGALSTALASKSRAVAAPAGGGVTVGLIGAGIRGLELMQAALNNGVRLVLVCDLYDGHLRRAQEIQPNTPTTRNFRPLARSGRDCRDEGRQRRLLREAHGSLDSRSGRNGESFARNGSHRPG